MEHEPGTNDETQRRTAWAPSPGGSSAPDRPCWPRRPRRRALRRLEAGDGERAADHPRGPETSWSEAIVWAIFSGAALGLARLVATRGAARYYMQSTGELPKALQREV